MPIPKDFLRKHYFKLNYRYEMRPFEKKHADAESLTEVSVSGSEPFTRLLNLSMFGVQPELEIDHWGIRLNYSFLDICLYLDYSIDGFTYMYVEFAE